jgi:hypothetical protein
MLQPFHYWKLNNFKCYILNNLLEHFVYYCRIVQPLFVQHGAEARTIVGCSARLLYTPLLLQQWHQKFSFLCMRVSWTYTWPNFSYLCDGHAEV